MRFVTDLRFLVAPLISLTHTVLTSQDKSWAQHVYQVTETFVQPASVTAYLFLLLVILVFLFTSLELPLTMDPMYVRVGRFSSSLTLSLLASILFPPSSFWIICPMLLAVSPWYPMMFEQLMRFMGWFYHTLQAIPALIITIVTQRQEEAEPAPRPLEIELTEIVINV